MTNKPKIKKIIKIGIASTEVTNATRPVEMPYPIQPPPSRIAVAPVPVEPLIIWARAVVLIISNNVPILIRPISPESSDDLNNRYAK